MGEAGLMGEGGCRKGEIGRHGGKEGGRGVGQEGKGWEGIEEVGREGGFGLGRGVTIEKSHVGPRTCVLNQVFIFL